MVERSSITQSSQIGVESTPGTLVACPRRLGSMGIEVSPSIDPKPLKPVGQKYASLLIPGKEMVEAEVSGMPVYTEVVYPFSSAINTPVVTSIMDGVTPTGAYRWTFDSSTYGDDNPKTFTWEQGSAFRAHRFGFGIFTEVSWAWSREEIEMSGSLLGRALEDGIALTPAPTMLPQIPVKPEDLSVYIDDTAAALGTTKSLRTLKGESNISDRYSPLWVVDQAQTSFVSTVEVEPTVEFKVTQMADAAGMAHMQAMRDGTTRFLRLQAVGPQIYSGGVNVNHQVTWDLAGQVGEVGSFSDEDGVYAIEWTFSTVHDPTWERAFQVEVITTTATL